MHEFSNAVESHIPLNKDGRLATKTSRPLLVFGLVPTWVPTFLVEMKWREPNYCCHRSPFLAQLHVVLVVQLHLLGNVTHQCPTTNPIHLGAPEEVVEGVADPVGGDAFLDLRLRQAIVPRVREAAW